MTLDLTIPLPGGRREITMRFPERFVSETDWRMLLAVLDAMRPALVAPDVTDAQIANAYSTDDLHEAARTLRGYADSMAARETDGAAVRSAEIRALADRLTAHERDTDD